MGFLSRILGICKTAPPADKGSWTYAGQTVEIDLARMPELGAPGGAVRLEGKGIPERLLILRGDGGEYHAFSNRCTHMGRRLDPLGEEGLECCSVSKSRYDLAGRRVSGPARNDLKTHAVETEQHKLIIHLQRHTRSFSTPGSP